MENSRWPKVCTEEIIRNIKNKNEPRWDADFGDLRWDEWGEPEITTKILY